MTVKRKRWLSFIGVAVVALVATTVLYSQSELPGPEVTVYRSPS